MIPGKSLLAILGGFTLATGWAQSVSKETYDFNYIGQPLPDPVLQHSKETFVLFGCAYCHGLDLVSRGEATDLMHSALVGRDENGNLIGPLLRKGIPQTAKLSPMPQFSDLSDHQIAALVRWIHYARAEGRYKEITAAKDLRPGDAAAGKLYFDEKCSSCHSFSGDMANLARKFDASDLRDKILRPKLLEDTQSWGIERLQDQKTATARRRHQALLENYSASDVQNVTAYLKTPR
jgi:mono/diheme cytochrome c family protein